MAGDLRAHPGLRPLMHSVRGPADLQGLPGALWSEAKEGVKLTACACPRPPVAPPCRGATTRDETRKDTRPLNRAWPEPRREPCSSLLSPEGCLLRARQGVQPATDQPSFPAGDPTWAGEGRPTLPAPRTPSLPATVRGATEPAHVLRTLQTPGADPRVLEGTHCPEPRGPRKLPSQPPRPQQMSLTGDSHSALIHTERSSHQHQEPAWKARASRGLPEMRA